MRLRFLPALLLGAALALPAAAQRHDVLLNDNWHFRFGHDVERTAGRRVDLPHTWNADDALAGRKDYKRGMGNYAKKLHVPAAWQGRRLFLRFEGAGNVADVFVNGRHAGRHRGGYGAFAVEITDRVRYGADNDLLVRVNNAEDLTLMPLVGDFNFYGGLYRDVHLVTTDATCISLLDHGSCGLRHRVVQQ